MPSNTSIYTLYTLYNREVNSNSHKASSTSMTSNNYHIQLPPELSNKLRGFHSESDNGTSFKDIFVAALELYFHEMQWGVPTTIDVPVTAGISDVTN